MNTATERNDACDEAVKEIVALRRENRALLEALEHLVSQIHFLKPTSSIANCCLSTQEAEAAIRLAKREIQ